MIGLITLIKEFCVFNSGALKVLVCLSPGVVWKFVYPEIYYSSGWSGYADFSILILMPLMVIFMIWEFIKHKRQPA
ncbi:hypothetical protein SAMN06265380_102261 [Ruegeria faecimaris]|uniref:Uncharacterized protein n=1 Tax=Ruegeria faecimaris TaxID=686389 RepID=A0A521CB87_9RHOB|nr:hypothetical protein SAMN06265380_102261 [Ruegeria faecimaris]